MADKEKLVGSLSLDISKLMQQLQEASNRIDDLSSKTSKGINIGISQDDFNKLTQQLQSISTSVEKMSTNIGRITQTTVSNIAQQVQQAVNQIDNVINSSTTIWTNKNGKQVAEQITSLKGNLLEITKTLNGNLQTTTTKNPLQGYKLTLTDIQNQYKALGVDGQKSLDNIIPLYQRADQLAQSLTGSLKQQNEAYTLRNQLEQKMQSLQAQTSSKQTAGQTATSTLKNLLTTMSTRGSASVQEYLDSLNQEKTNAQNILDVQKQIEQTKNRQKSLNDDLIKQESEQSKQFAAQLKTQMQQEVTAQKTSDKLKLSNEASYSSALQSRVQDITNKPVVDSSTISGKFQNSAIYMMSGIANMQIMNAIGSVASQVTSYEKNLNDLQKVMSNLSDNGMNKLGESAQRLSINFGQDLNSTQQVMTSLAKAGVEDQKSLEDLTGTMLTLMNTSEDMTPETATTGLVSTLKQYGMDYSQAEKVIDSFTVLANATVADTSDFMDASSKAGGAMKNLGVDFDTFQGIVAQLSQSLGENGAEIGTAMEAFSSHMLQPKSVKTLEDFGIQIKTIGKDGKEAFLPFIDIMTNINNHIKDLDENSVEYQTILQAMGGSLRKNVVNSIVSGWQDIIKYQKESANSGGAAAEMSNKSLQTISKQLKILGSDATSAIIQISQATGLQDIFHGTISAIDGAVKILGTLDGQTGKFLLTLGALSLSLKGINAVVRNFAGIDLSKSMSSSALSGLSGLLGNIKIGGNQAFSGLASKLQYGAMGVESPQEYSKALNKMISTLAEADIPQKAFDDALNSGIKAMGLAGTNAEALGVSYSQLKKRADENHVSIKDLTNTTTASQVASENAVVTTKQLAAGLKVQSDGAKVAKNSMIALNVASVALNIGISAIVSGIISFVTWQLQANERQREALQAASETASKYKDETNSLQELIAQYTDISSKTAQTADDKSQLKSIQDQLISSFGNEAKSLDLVNGKYSDQIILLQKLTKEEAEDFIKSNQQNYNQAKSTLSKIETIEMYQSNKSGVVKPSIEGLSSRLTSGISGIKYEGSIGAGTDSGYSITGDLEQRVKILGEIVLRAGSLNNLTKNEEEAVGEVSNQYKTLKTQLDQSKTVVEQMANAQLNSKYSKQIDDIRRAYEQYQAALKKGDNSAVNKASDSFEKAKQKALAAVGGNKELREALILLINSFGDTGDAANSASSATNKAGSSASQAANHYNVMGDAVDEAGNKIQDSADQTQSMSDKVKESISELSALNDALYKVQHSESLNADEIMSLLEVHPELISAIRITSDGYTIEQSALKSLIAAKVQAAEEGIQSEIDLTNKTIDSIQTRIDGYKAEAKAILGINEISSLQNSAMEPIYDDIMGSISGAQKDLDVQKDKLKNLNNQKNIYDALLRDIGTEKNEKADERDAEAAERKAEEEARKKQQAQVKAIEGQEKLLDREEKARVQDLENQTQELEKQKDALQAQLDLIQKQHEAYETAKERQEDVDKVNEAKQELDKAKKELEETENNKNVMLLTNGKPVAIADPEKVKEAKDAVDEATKNLQDAQKTLADFDAQQAYQKQVDAIQAQIDAIEQKKSAVEQQKTTIQNDYDARKQELEDQKNQIQGYYASGTDYVPTTGEYVVGEKGPEIVHLSKGSEVISNKDLNASVTIAESITQDIGDTLQSLANAAIEYGQLVDKNLAAGLNQNTPPVIRSTNDILNTLMQNYQGFINKCVTYGQLVDKNLSNGLNAQRDVPIHTNQDTVNSLGSQFQNFISSCLNYGKGIDNELANGIKDSDTQANLMNEVTTLTKKVVDGFNNGFGIASPSKVMYKIGNYLMQGLINGMTSEDINSFIQNSVSKMVGTATGAVNGNVQEWLTSALLASGTSMEWLPGLAKLVQFESGGDPISINSTPIGNEHATGLLQTLPSTFREYMKKGFENIFNPVDNAIAAINYIKDRYGSVYNTPLFTKPGKYYGYANGTSGVSENQVAMVGENGPELTVLPQGAGVIPNNMTEKLINLADIYSKVNVPNNILGQATSAFTTPNNTNGGVTYYYDAHDFVVQSQNPMDAFNEIIRSAKGHASIKSIERQLG